MSLIDKGKMEAPPLLVFHFFNLLPFEIREIIWEFALPSRVILADPTCELVGVKKASFSPETAMRTCEQEIWQRNARPPTILEVCKESHNVARKYGALLAVLRRPLASYFEAYPGQMTGLLPPNLRAGDYLFTWFDPRKDTLLLFQQYFFQIGGFIPAAGMLMRPNRNVLQNERQLARYQHPRHELATLVDLDIGRRRTRPNALDVCIIWPTNLSPTYDVRVFPLMVDSLSQIRHFGEISVVVHEIIIHVRRIPQRGVPPTPRDMEVRQLCDDLFGEESPQRLVSTDDRPLLDHFVHLAKLTQSTEIWPTNCPYQHTPRSVSTFDGDLTSRLASFQGIEARVRAEWVLRPLDWWKASRMGFKLAEASSGNLTAIPPFPKLKPVVLFRHCGVRPFTHEEDRRTMSRGGIN